MTRTVGKTLLSYAFGIGTLVTLDGCRPPSIHAGMIGVPYDLVECQVACATPQNCTLISLHYTNSVNGLDVTFTSEPAPATRQLQIEDANGTGLDATLRDALNRNKAILAANVFSAVQDTDYVPVMQKDGTQFFKSAHLFPTEDAQIHVTGMSSAATDTTRNVSTVNVPRTVFTRGMKLGL